MTQAIASSITAAATAYGGSKPSATTLQAQLQRYQQQLSDCVNCATADTPQGKSDIQAIAARITQVQQRIAQADGARGTSSGVATQAAQQTTPVSNSPRGGTSPGAVTQTAQPASSLSTSVLGSTIDVFA